LKNVGKLHIFKSNQNIASEHNMPIEIEEDEDEDER